MSETQHKTWLAMLPVLGVVAVVLCLLGGTGCAGTGRTFNAEHSASNVELPQPPAVPQQFSAPVSQRAQAAALIAPPQPRTATWRWQFPPGHRVAYWEASEDLQAWRIDGWTTNSFATFHLTNRQRFFRFYSLPWQTSLRMPAGQAQPPDFWQP